MDFYGVPVTKGPIVVFWSHRDSRRVVVPLGWPEAKALWKRLLDRFRGGRQHYINSQGELARLMDVGTPLTARLGRHTVGLVRPHQFAAVGESEPVMICKERGPTRREPHLPILAPDVDAARDLVRRLQSRGVAVADWRCYAGERLDTPVEKLFRRTAAGGVVGRTVLEDDLVQSFGARGQQRQGFPPLPAYTPADLPDFNDPAQPVPAAGSLSDFPS